MSLILDALRRKQEPDEPSRAETQRTNVSHAP